MGYINDDKKMTQSLQNRTQFYDNSTLLITQAELS